MDIAASVRDAFLLIFDLIVEAEPSTYLIAGGAIVLLWWLLRPR